MPESIFGPPTIETIRLLIRSRHYESALINLDSGLLAASSDDRLRLRRQCLARMNRKAEAAAEGQRLLETHDATAEDAYRQAQLLLDNENWEAALDAASIALAQTPDDPRLVIPLAQAVLAEPSLYDRLAAMLRVAHGAAEQAGPKAVPTQTTARPGRIFVPLRLPYYRSYDAAHPGTMGMLEQAGGLDIFAPAMAPPPWPRLLPAVRRAMSLIKPLTALHPLVDRAAAARYIADRLPTLMVDAGHAQFDFLSNLPMTLGQRPWVLWYDIPGTLFQPFQPFESTDVRAMTTPWYWILRAFLESKRCLRIITHYPIADNALSLLFRSKIIDSKLVFINPCHSRGSSPRPTPLRRGTEGDRPIRMLFTSSFHAREEDFFYRGGVDVLTAFLDLADSFDIELILRAAIPSTLGPNLRHRALNHPRIRWITGFVPDPEYQALIQECDLFLLPSVVLYRNGLVQAIRAGQVPVVSDMPGIEPLVKGANGIVVPGRRRLTILDATTQTLRHEWHYLLQAVEVPADSEFQQAFAAALRRLLANPASITARANDNLATAHDGHDDEDQRRFTQVMRDAAATAARLGSDGSEL